VAIAKKLLSLALAIVGLVLLVTGLWFATHLGTSGDATFRWTASGTSPVVLQPSLINRVDEPLTVKVTPAAGDSVWTGIGAPSDVDAAIGTTPATRLTRVALRPWSVLARATGSGTPASVADAEIWRTRSTTSGAVTIAVDQRTAPESIVVRGEKSPLQSVTVTWRHRTWFYQSLVLAFVGLLLAAVGSGALVAGLRSGRGERS